MSLSIPSISTVCDEDNSKMDTDIEEAPISQTGTDGSQPGSPGILNPDEQPFDWSSPDDPDCGQNWTLPVKIYHSVIVAAMGFLM